MIKPSSDPLTLRLQSAFASNRLYFTMMAEHHRRQGGAAIEPEVQQIICQHCVPGARILEAGCGEGSITNWFAAGFAQTSFVGVDISPIGIALAREAATARFNVGDITQLPFADAEFDFVYSQSVIEHVPRWQEFLGEAWRVLAAGGELLIRVGNGGVQGRRRRQALFRYLLRRNRVLACQPSLRLQPGNSFDHSHNFDAQEIPSDVLLRTLKRAGFGIAYFTTRAEQWTRNPALRLAARLGLWPLHHLGPVTIVLGRKKP
jgi:SAM-dependent methyltransferase